ncbi:hypothetical protein ACFYPN_11205 [Streptomyces sp. NPDC005576]|uniref:hypothetical protein n=1 Tax=unclassified Streptomyces TaxID=2593676 RepID=UPI0033DF706D
MAEAQKDSKLTTQDMHATGTEVAGGELTTLDMHATGTPKGLTTSGTATTDDMHATSEPVT